MPVVMQAEHFNQGDPSSPSRGAGQVATEPSVKLEREKGRNGGKGYHREAGCSGTAWLSGHRTH